MANAVVKFPEDGIWRWVEFKAAQAGISAQDFVRFCVQKEFFQVPSGNPAGTLWYPSGNPAMNNQDFTQVPNGNPMGTQREPSLARAGEYPSEKLLIEELKTKTYKDKWRPDMPCPKELKGEVRRLAWYVDNLPDAEIQRDKPYGALILFCRKWKTRHGKGQTHYGVKFGRDIERIGDFLDCAAVQGRPIDDVIDAYLGLADKWLSDAGYSVSLFTTKAAQVTLALAHGGETPARSSGFIQPVQEPFCPHRKNCEYAREPENVVGEMRCDAHGAIYTRKEKHEKWETESWDTYCWVDLEECDQSKPRLEEVPFEAAR